MRHEINSLNTKKALAKALKDVIERSKPHHKITVSDIVESCGVNRNTFYYHFPDVNELILWTLRSDIYEHIRTFDCFNGKQIREFTVDYFQSNGRFLNFAYQIVGFDAFRDNYLDGLYPIIMDYIDSLEDKNKLNISPMYKKFVAEFYAEQVGSIYLMQFRRPDRYHRAAAMRCLELIFDFSIPDSLAHEKDIEFQEG